MGTKALAMLKQKKIVSKVRPWDAHGPDRAGD